MESKNIISQLPEKQTHLITMAVSVIAGGIWTAICSWSGYMVKKSNPEQLQKIFEQFSKEDYRNGAVSAFLLTYASCEFDGCAKDFLNCIGVSNELFKQAAGFGTGISTISLVTYFQYRAKTFSKELLIANTVISVISYVHFKLFEIKQELEIKSLKKMFEEKLKVEFDGRFRNKKDPLPTPPKKPIEQQKQEITGSISLLNQAKKTFQESLTKQRELLTQDLQQQTFNHKEELNRLKDENQNKVMDLKQQIAELNKEIEALKKKLELKEELSSPKAEKTYINFIEDIDKSLKRESKNLQQVSPDIDYLKTVEALVQYENLQKDFQILKTELSQKKKEIVKLNKKIEGDQHTIADLQNKLTEKNQK